MKIMEGGEEKAQETYNKISGEIREANEIFQDEIKHENLLIAMIDEKRLNYISSMVQGLNDALIELAGELAGFTFALQNTQLIGFAGLIAGIAQFLSSSYVFTVLILIIPYFISTSYSAALLVTILMTFVIIIFFTFYVSVVKSLSLRKMFSTMIFITLGVGAISFLIGWIAKVVLNL